MDGRYAHYKMLDDCPPFDPGEKAGCVGSMGTLKHQHLVGVGRDFPIWTKTSPPMLYSSRQIGHTSNSSFSSISRLCTPLTPKLSKVQIRKLLPLQYYLCDIQPIKIISTNLKSNSIRHCWRCSSSPEPNPDTG